MAVSLIVRDDDEALGLFQSDIGKPDLASKNAGYSSCAHRFAAFQNAQIEGQSVSNQAGGSRVVGQVNEDRA